MIPALRNGSLQAPTQPSSPTDHSRHEEEKRSPVRDWWSSRSGACRALRAVNTAQAAFTISHCYVTFATLPAILCIGTGRERETGQCYSTCPCCNCYCSSSECCQVHQSWKRCHHHGHTTVALPILTLQGHRGGQSHGVSLAMSFF